MEVEDNQKEIISAKEISAIIQNSQYGEYDHNHEWSPSYSLQDKAGFLENMLKNWGKTEPKGKTLIIQFVRMLIQESGSSALDITDKLVLYAHHPEIVSVVNEFLLYGIFCRDLLISMKNFQVRQEDWLIKIRNNSAERKFIYKKREINVKDHYREIQHLISDLS